MAVDEAGRRELFTSLSGLLGEDMATALFDHLPPAGRDVATSRDVVMLEESMSERIAALETSMSERIAALEGSTSERIAALDTSTGERIAAMEERLTERLLRQRAQMSADWRRDLLIHGMGQFFALVAAVAALVALG